MTRSAQLNAHVIKLLGTYVECCVIEFRAEIAATRAHVIKPPCRNVHCKPCRHWINARDNAESARKRFRAAIKDETVNG